jgi:hypothetical protein
VLGFHQPLLFLVEPNARDAVDEQATEVQVLARAEPPVELDGFIDGQGLGHRDDVDRASLLVADELARAIEHLAEGAVLEKDFEDAWKVEEHQRVPSRLEVHQDRAPSFIPGELRHAVQGHDLVHSRGGHEQAPQRVVLGDEGRNRTELEPRRDVVDQRGLELNPRRMHAGRHLRRFVPDIGAVK